MGQGKNMYFGRHFASLKCFTFHLLLVPVLAPNYVFVLLFDMFSSEISRNTTFSCMSAVLRILYGTPTNYELY
jgi:hypothetical protein